MLTTAARAGELELVSHTKQADGLHFRVTSLSPFGVSWVKYAAPSGGGSGGSGGSGGGIFNPAYNIMVERTMNGSITVSPSSAAKGSTVTIMVYPDRGYELEMLMVMDKKGSELDLRKWGGEYSFIMPAGDVTVRARFVEEAPTQSFADVSTDAYYYEAVKWAAKNSITGGVGNGLFAPDAPCTRAQIVTFLWRAAGSPEPKNASSFSDVPASAYYARSVAWAVENGITTGTGQWKILTRCYLYEGAKRDLPLPCAKYQGRGYSGVPRCSQKRVLCGCGGMGCSKRHHHRHRRRAVRSR